MKKTTIESDKNKQAASILRRVKVKTGVKAGYAECRACGMVSNPCSVCGMAASGLGG